MLIVLGVYLLTMSGHTYSTDEETMLASSWSLVESGRWDIHPSESWVHVQGVDGRYYSVFGPGQQLAAVPWVAGGLFVDGLFPKEQSGFALRLVLGTYNALVTAGLCALLAAVGMRLGYSERASLILGGTLAFATFLWPHSRTFFAEPMVALLFVASFYLLLRARTTNLLFVSGVLCALALLFKVQYAVALPAFFLYLILQGADNTQQVTDNSTISGKQPPTTQISKVRTQNLLLLWLSGLAVGLVPLFAYNWAIFGNPIQTGYGTDLSSLFRTPILEGALGLLLSPGKGLLWYAPALLLSLAGIRRFAGRHRAEAIHVLALTVSLVAFFAMFHLWWGGGAWGPRFLAPLVPFALLPALPVIEGTLHRPSFLPSGPIVQRLAVASVIASGFLLNLPGVLLNFDTYVNSGVDEERRIWEPRASPLVGHIEMLGRLLRPNDGLLTLLKPSGAIYLKRGFSYSEGDRQRGELLPRWTTGNGGLEIRPNASRGAVNVTLRIADHRPPEIPRAAVTILVNNAPAQVSASPVEGSPISTDYSFPVTSSRTTVEIRSLTWNPALSGASSRNEDIGVKLERISVSEGGTERDYRLIEDLPPPAYYPTPRWYYDPEAKHPADLWFVYLARIDMGRRAMLMLGGPVVLAGLGCIGTALWMGRASHGRGRNVVKNYKSTANTEEAEKDRG